MTSAKTNAKGNFSNRTFTIPAGTANGTYTVAAIGATTQTLAQAQFTVGSVPQGPAPAASDWANFGFDLQNTRVNPTETTISPSNVSTLAAKWTTPNPVPSKTVGSPTIANGIVYLATVEGVVTAYNQATGNILWVFYANGPVYGSPTIVNGIAYFASVNYPAEDIIGNYAYALNATTGALIWDNFLPYGGDWVAPLVANGRVFVPEAYKEGISGGFSTFDALTGKLLWSVKTPYGIWASPTLDPSGNNLFIGTGNPCTSTGTPGDGCSGYEEDLNPATGATIWSYHFPDISGDDDVPAAAAYNSGKLYVGLKNGIFYAIDATNGNVLWQYNTGKSGDFGIYSSATFSTNKVIFGGGDHLVHALNISDGSLAWTFTTGSLVTASPSVANGVVYIGSVDKNFYALNPDTGTQLCKINLGASVWPSAIVSSGVVYIGGGDGTLYALTPGGV
jgi:outer membrane protein assembly factor BamB